MPALSLPPVAIVVLTITLLSLSNIFMTFAWYGHLKFKATPLLMVIFISWGIAFFEYVLQVPANRIGHRVLSAAELKTIQEVITLTVFAVFSVWYLGEPLYWKHAVGFMLIAAGSCSHFPCVISGQKRRLRQLLVCLSCVNACLRIERRGSAKG